MVKRRDFLKSGLALGALLSGPSHPASQSQRADSIPLGIKETSPHGKDLALVNAKILTMEAQQPEASAALVRNGRIALVGTTTEVKAQARRVREFDAAGRVVVPGFIDTHTHFEIACYYYAGYQVDVHTPPLTSLHQIVDRLHAKAAQTPKGKWVIGRSSYSLASHVTEKRMATRQDLDAITQDHPVMLMSGLHVVMLNTRGFKELGLWDANSANDLRWRDGKRRMGTDIARDANGRPTGVVTEIYDLLPETLYSPEEKRAAIKTQAVTHFVSKGITSLATMPFFRNDYPIDQQLQAAGDLPLRLRAYYIVPMMISLDGILDTGLLPGAGDEMFRFGGIKLFVAGAGVDAHGKLLTDVKWSQHELDETVARAHAAGVQVIMHMAGHESLDMALDAVEKAQRRDPRALRHRLEHYGELESMDEIRRVKRLGMRLTITLPQEKYAAAYTRTAKIPRYHTLIQEGLEPIAISDSTGTIPVFSPLFGLASVTAKPEDGGSAPIGEAVSLDDAFRMWTLWAARGVFEEQDKGSIATGKLGDFAVLPRDPRAIPGSELFDMKVDATILGGDVVFERR